MEKPLRLAIIIGAFGKGRNFLPGVGIDILRMKDYLLSPRGGGWLDNEIKIIQPASVSDIINMVVQVSYVCPEYVFIYFSGHGYTDPDSAKRYINLHDGVLHDRQLLLPSVVKQLIIIDACGTFLGSRISGIPEYGDPCLNFTGDSAARDLFNQWIVKSHAGKIIYHAASPGESAVEENGGIFTKAFLDATSLRKSKSLRPVFLDEILQTVNNLIVDRGYDQKPQVVYRTGNIKVPVAIQIPVNENNASELVPFSHFQHNGPDRFISTSAATVWNTIAAFSLLLIAGGFLLNE